MSDGTTPGIFYGKMSTNSCSLGLMSGICCVIIYTISCIRVGVHTIMVCLTVLYMCMWSPKSLLFEIMTHCFVVRDNFK